MLLHLISILCARVRFVMRSESRLVCVAGQVLVVCLQFHWFVRFQRWHVVGSRLHWFGYTLPEMSRIIIV